MSTANKNYPLIKETDSTGNPLNAYDQLVTESNNFRRAVDKDINEVENSVGDVSAEIDTALKAVADWVESTEIRHLPSGTDYNTVTEAGVYVISSGVNTPSINAPFLSSHTNFMIVFRHPNVTTWSQFVIGLGQDSIATRRIVGDTDFSRSWVTYATN